MKPMDKFAEGAQAGQKRRAGATFLPRFKIIAAAQSWTTSFNPLPYRESAGPVAVYGF